MLDIMRRHAQSWMIKAVLGAVVVVFVAWGVWSPNESRQRELVKVGPYVISVTEARNYYQNLKDRYQAVYGERFTEEMAKKLNLKEKAVKDLTNRLLLLQEAQRLGLKVTSEELQASIHEISAFQKDGVFDKATYVRALQRARLTPNEFEANQKQALLLNKLQGIVVSSVKISDQEVWEAYRQNFEKVNLETISLDPSQMKEVSSSPEEVKEYFSKHKEEFKTPVRVKARYILFDPKDYFKQVQISPKEIEDYYQNNKEKFGQPKKVKVRHILIKAEGKDAEVTAKAKEKAESIRKEAAEGKDFAKLAKQYSEDPGTKDRGGELGYISKGMVVPEFEEAAFSLKAGEISAVIQTPYGFHILKVDDVQEARTEPLEKAKDQVDALLRNRKAREMAYDMADQAYAAGSKEKKLDGFAEEKKLTVKETPLFSAEDRIELDPKLKSSALSLGKGDISPSLRVGESFAVLQVTERQEARNPDLKEVEKQVSEKVRIQKQKDKALAKAKEMVEKLKKGAEFKSAAAQEGLKVEETGFFPRGSAPPKLTATEDLRKTISSLAPKTPYSETPILQGEKYVLLHLKETKEVEKEQFQAQKDNYHRALLQMKQEMFLAQWVEDLLERAKAKGEYKAYQEVNEAI